MKEVSISAEELKRFAKIVLLRTGVREDVADYVSEGLVQTSLRGVDSHGIRLLPHYLAAVKGGRINPNPHYKFKKTFASAGILDADHTFGHAAGMEAVKKAMEIANDAGTAHIAVCNSTHFGAAAYYALEIAKNDMIGLSFTHADALMKSYGGKKAFLGTNPIAFAAPLKDEGPFCLDMATSAVTFNKIKQLREEKKKAPSGVGADKEGVETTDPDEIAMLFPIGGHKGYGLSLMVEVLCSMLTGMPYGPHISKMFAAPLSEKRFLGHFIIAMRIDCFQDKKVFKERLSKMIEELRSQPSLDKDIPVQVAGDPEKKILSERSQKGIPLKGGTLESLIKLSESFKVELSVIDGALE
ncbi:MAG: Ldh family oxidoreductase [Candidatus Omnitrophota bacterium]